MEKKMYNQPLTITTEVETMSVIMSVTQSVGGDNTQPQIGVGGGGDAPARYPRY